MAILQKKVTADGVAFTTSSPYALHPLERETFKEKLEKRIKNFRRHANYMYTSIMKTIFPPKKVFKTDAHYDVRRALYSFGLKEYTHSGKAEIYRLPISVTFPLEELAALQQFFAQRGWETQLLISRNKSSKEVAYYSVEALPELKSWMNINLVISKESFKV